MGKRRGFGALIGAAILTLAAVGSVSAVPSYTFDVTKTADPPTVPVSGGDVTFTVAVHNTGSGSFAVVQLTDPLAGCTLGAPTGDDGDGSFESGETWSYTCTVTGVDPNTENTVTVDACHNSSPNCKQDDQHVEHTAQVTVGLCESDCVVTTPGPTSDGGGGGQSDTPTSPTTDSAAVTGTSGPSDAAWLLIAVFGALLGSLVVLRPATSRKRG